ncbi:MAG TPA: hypothetical protein VLJ12_08455 [Burkholderiales bacterium]|nr:hypothetical protein [Burkholderiales bacterium]
MNVIIIGAGMTGIAFGPIHQDQAYHRFADGRVLLGVQNFADVASSFAFVLVGIAGVLLLWRSSAGRFSSSDEWRGYWWFFCAVALAGIGSAYYHLAPDDARLAWDRMPIAVAFMCLLSALLTERLRISHGRALLAALAVLGAASVVYWRVFDDLRPYALAQFGSLAAIVLLCAWYPSRFSQGWVVFLVTALYGLAKLCELRDPEIYELTRHLLSGHTLKHLISAAAIAVLLWWVTFRQPISTSHG